MRTLRAQLWRKNAGELARIAVRAAPQLAVDHDATAEAAINVDVGETSNRITHAVERLAGGGRAAVVLDPYRHAQPLFEGALEIRQCPALQAYGSGELAATTGEESWK